MSRSSRRRSGCRSVSIAMAVAFTAFSLAGCGGGDEKPPVSAPAAEKSSDPMAAASEAAKAAKVAGSDAMETAKQTGSDAMETAKQTGSDAMAAAKQTGSDAMASAKQTGSDAMASAKQTGADAMAAAKAKGNEMAQAASEDLSGVPSGNLRGDAAHGKELYMKFCVSCHGESGKGDGPVGKTLNPHPADHTNTAYFKTLSDAHVYKVIDKGGASVGKSPLMAPWGGIVKEQGVKDLVAYVRKLSGT